VVDWGRERTAKGAPEREERMKLSVEFKIEGHDVSVGEAVRVWIDVDRSGQLADEEEVDLGQQDLTWTGSIQSGQSSSKDMMFLVKYIASPGTATWSLTIRSDAPNDHAVFEGKGEVNTLQARLIGALRS